MRNSLNNANYTLMHIIQQQSYWYYSVTKLGIPNLALSLTLLTDKVLLKAN